MLDFILHFNEHLNEILHDYGSYTYAILFFIIFAETGFVITPFLPGDSLLFAVGAKAADPASGLDLTLTLILLSIAAILGNTVNYFIGRKIGPSIFGKDTRFIKKEYLFRTQKFYEKYGAAAVILSRFLPIFRTFVPFVAGIGKMDWQKYMLYNIIGGVSWVLVGTLAGYQFGGYEWVQKHFEALVVGIIVVSLVPAVATAVVEYLKTRKK